MIYNFSDFRKELESIEMWLQKEFSGIRTGIATPALLDNLTIDSYGAKSPIAHVAGITTENARTLRIVPWDKTYTKEIEKTITKANLGVSVSVDDSGLRVSFPELTAERRSILKKLVNEKVEKAKVSIRGERDKIWNDIQNKCKEGDVSEDEKFRYKEELQDIVDEEKEKLDEMGRKKEKEVMG